MLSALYVKPPDPEKLDRFENYESIAPENSVLNSYLIGKNLDLGTLDLSACHTNFPMWGPGISAHAWVLACFSFNSYSGLPLFKSGTPSPFTLSPCNAGQRCISLFEKMLTKAEEQGTKVWTSFRKESSSSYRNNWNNSFEHCIGPPHREPLGPRLVIPFFPQPDKDNFQLRPAPLFLLCLAWFM